MDISKLPKHFDSKSAEQKWSRWWQDRGLYHYHGILDPAPAYSIDTPPPTVSGSLHVGHVFSFTHTDLVARFQRMRGKDVLYPMGWDDNGLPTERRVQNYFHVRCNPALPYNPDLQIASADIKPKSLPLEISRANFIELCLRLTTEDEKAFKELWTRVGLSVDWRLEYSTIDSRSRATAQHSFIDLWHKGHVYNVEAPVMWDVDFQTAVAQAEVEDRQVLGAFHRIRFSVEDSTETFTIATTRPELLAACVGVTAHPDDARYRHLFGRHAITPLFRISVPIFPSELVDPEKGSGILMVCTFGDATDLYWWRERKLRLRQIMGSNGRLVPIVFGREDWRSIDPETANSYYSRIAEKTVREARRIIVDLLRNTDAALVDEPTPIQHPVKFYEKGDQPLEFISTRQWFVRLIDKKGQLIEFGDRIQWHPEFMRHRYRNWTENLAFDWAISRQRYFGVPFPLWYRIGQDGAIDYQRPLIASEDMLPIDPSATTPPGFSEAQRHQPGGFTSEPDVFDTWFTSSLTPQIVARWREDPEHFSRMFPMDLRPQSHEIIRTWAFYTIVKAYLHHNQIPWRSVAISGWVTDPDRKKMSKSRGNVVTPLHLLEEYGSDAVRYWSASAQLGSDTAFDVNVFKIGRRLVTKIFNAAKFVLARECASSPITYFMDCVFLSRLSDLVGRATSALENYEHHLALAETERFFWTAFTDTFIEITRARTQGALGLEAQVSAISALHLALNVLLRLFAPFLPYITEEVWSWEFSARTGHTSIHTAPWPSETDFAGIAFYESGDIFNVATQAMFVINRGKSQAGVSTAREIQRVVLAASPTLLDWLHTVKDDVRFAVRARELSIIGNTDLRDSGVELRELQIV